MRHFLEVLGLEKTKEITDLLLTLPLFDGVDGTILSRCIDSDGAIARSYRSGELIYTPDAKNKKLIVFLSGEAEVYTADESRSTLLRRVRRGGIVGVANLFSDEGFVSRIIAAKKCETLEISAEAVGKIIEEDRRMMRNYLVFLSNKICYLNRKIVTLTAGSAERRLAYYLSSCSEELGDDSFTLPLPMNALAEALNLGRASLYRAEERLTSDGFLCRDGKKVTISHKEQMLQKYDC